MKKILTLALALLVCASMVACSDSKENDEVVDNVVENLQDETDVEPEIEDEAGVSDENAEPDETEEGEEETDVEDSSDVVVETTPVDPDVDVPAVMPDEDNMPAVMPELDAEVDVEAPEAETPEVEDAPAEDAGSIDALYELADKLYAGINPEEMPMVGTMELNEENFEYSAFVPYKSSYLAVESLPMMGSQPHSVVIVKTGSEEEAAALAAEMEANADPRKWICVQAKAVKSASKGNLAILVMTSVDVMPSDDVSEEEAESKSFELSEERANTIIANFLAA